MTEDWKTYKLGELAELTMGQSPKGSTTNRTGQGMPLLNGPTEFGYSYPLPAQFTSDPKRVSEKGDLLFCVRGSTTGKMNFSDQSYAIGRGIGAFKGKNGFSTKYVKYLIDLNLEKMLSISTGSTFPNLSRNDLLNFEMSSSDSKEAGAIASILSALDDKIELNLQMNKTLEEMAMALYKHWFVDFGPFQNGKFVDSEVGLIPEGWEVKRIGDLYKTTSGGTPSRSKNEYYDNGFIPWVKSKELYGTFVIDTEEKISQLGLNKSSAKLIPAKSVLLAMYGATVGESSIISIEATCNQAICGIIEINISYLYIFHYLRYYKIDVLNQATGSAQQNISQEIIKNLKIIEPEKSLTVFSELESFYNVIEQNLIENQSLITLRDTLLPKLISGEVRVKEVEKLVHESL